MRRRERRVVRVRGFARAIGTRRRWRGQNLIYYSTFFKEGGKIEMVGRGCVVENLFGQLGAPPHISARFKCMNSIETYGEKKVLKHRHLVPKTTK